MIEFAEADFALSVKLEDGYSKRDHLLSAFKQTGIMDDELANAPEMPTQLQYLWAYFWELSRSRQNNGFGLSPLQYSDIEAWCRLTRQRLDPWELNAILRLDALFLKSMAKPKAEG